MWSATVFFKDPFAMLSGKRHSIRRGTGFVCAGLFRALSFVLHSMMREFGLGMMKSLYYTTRSNGFCISSTRQSFVRLRMAGTAIPGLTSGQLQYGSYCLLNGEEHSAQIFLGQAPKGSAPPGHVWRMEPSSKFQGGHLELGVDSFGRNSGSSL